MNIGTTWGGSSTRCFILTATDSCQMSVLDCQNGKPLKELRGLLHLGGNNAPQQEQGRRVQVEPCQYGFSAVRALASLDMSASNSSMSSREPTLAP